MGRPAAVSAIAFALAVAAGLPTAAGAQHAAAEHAAPAPAPKASPAPKRRAVVAASGADPQLLEAAARIRARLATVSVGRTGGARRQPARAAAAAAAASGAGREDERPEAQRVTLRWRLTLQWPDELSR